MIILTGFYNAEDFVEKSLGSIMGQNHKDFTCYITHDMSTDNSVNIVKEMIANDSRFILFDNYEKKLYQAGNFDMSIRNNPNIKDDDVCIEVDGDDWLPDANVFTRINNTYSDPNVWIANGSFRYSSGHQGFAKPQSNFKTLRRDQFTASHIRTWKAFLWRKIKPEDLRDSNSDYWQWSGDLCFMFPMLEMAGPEHYKFMTEINYTYNGENPINEHKVDIGMVQDHAKQIRSKPPYQRLML